MHSIDKENEYQGVLAFIKYEGKLVEEGYLDARKSADVLYGIDEALRYFLYREDPVTREIDFDIPVRVRKGSWEALIPNNENLFLLMAAGATWAGAKYVGSALSEIAKNDFKDVSFKDLFKGAVKGMQSVIRIAKHVGTLAQQKFDNVRFSEDNSQIGIPNGEGIILWIEKEYLDLYVECPEKLMSKLAAIIEAERELKIGLLGSDQSFQVEEIRTYDKHIFTKESKEEEEVLFPELEHGQYIEIEGDVTRGNEKSNSIGFLYKGHILTCYPAKGNIRNFKSSMFTHCIIKGNIDRMSTDGRYIEKRPRICFTALHLIIRGTNQTSLDI